MQPITRDLAIPQGTSWAAGWKLATSGLPFFDASWTGRAQVRARKNAAEVLHEWSTAAGTLTISNDGTVILSVDPATSSAWAWDFGVYDLEVSQDLVTHRLLEGMITVDREVTR